MRSMEPPMRAVLGFVAGVISVRLTAHDCVIGLLSSEPGGLTAPAWLP
jgi:hypothetical protein